MFCVSYIFVCIYDCFMCVLFTKLIFTPICFRHNQRVFFVLNGSFYPSTPSTTSVRASWRDELCVHEPKPMRQKCSMQIEQGELAIQCHPQRARRRNAKTCKPAHQTLAVKGEKKIKDEQEKRKRKEKTIGKSEGNRTVRLK